MRAKNLVLAAAALIPSASAASAATITQTASYGPLETNWTDSLAFVGFDSSLGVLNGISILAIENTQGTLTNRNNSASPSVVTSKILNAWSATLPGVLDGLSALTGNTVSSTAVNTLAGRTTGATAQVSGSSQAIVALQPGQALTPYQRAFSVDVTESGAVLVTATDGNGAAVYADFGKINIAVVYTYSAAIVPPANGGLSVTEPATFALLGSGLVGIVLTGRRRIGRRQPDQCCQAG